MQGPMPVSKEAAFTRDRSSEADPTPRSLLEQSSGWFWPSAIHSVIWEFRLLIVDSPGESPVLYRNAVLSSMYMRLCRIIGLHLRIQPEKFENQCAIGRQFQVGCFFVVFMPHSTNLEKSLSQWLLQHLLSRFNSRRNTYPYLSHSFLQYLLLSAPRDDFQRWFPEMAWLSTVMLIFCLNSMSKAEGDFGVLFCFFLVRHI